MPDDRPCAQETSLPWSALYSLLMEAPAIICVLRGPDLVFDLVNPLYQRLFGARQLSGRPIREALPELEGQGFFELLERVFTTGRPFSGKEVPAWLDRDGEGRLEQTFFNFVYQPMRGSGGSIEGVMVFGFDVTEQVLARRQANRLAENLRHADRARNEFIAIVAHELRTPMTSILGWVRLLRLGGLDEATHEAAMEALERSTLAQAKIIEDLLDESRIASGKLRLELRRVDLVAVLDDAMAMVRPVAEAKGIEILRSVAPASYDMSGDPGRLQQVISNVLTNAVKFSPEGGRVEIVMERGNDAAVLTIRDHGRGIARSILPHVFERFRQGGGSERHGGLGLGLSIARHLIELHGGTIDAASEGEGKGAVFTLHFPLLAAMAGEEYVRRDAGRVAALPSLAGVRTLLVEDDYDNRNMIATVIGRCGAEVECSTSAADALERIGDYKPDVIIADIALPDIDGCQFLREIRASEDGDLKETPAIAVTVLGAPEELERITRAGFDVVRQKPVEPADLANDVARLVGRGAA